MITAIVARPRKRAFVAMRVRDWEVAIASEWYRTKEMSNVGDKCRRTTAQVSETGFREPQGMEAVVIDGLQDLFWYIEERG